MSNNTKASNLEINFAGFDFNKDDMQFIRHQFEGTVNGPAAKLAEELRWWGKERAGNPSAVVNYEIRGAKVNGSLVIGMESIHVTDCLDDEAAKITTNFKVAGVENFTIDKAYIVAAGVALHAYDAALADARPELDPMYLSAYFSLRAHIATAAHLACTTELREHSVAFYIPDGERMYMFKVNVSHFKLADFGGVNLSGN